MHASGRAMPSAPVGGAALAPTAAAMLGFGSPAFAQPGLGAKPRSRMRADESGGSPPATVARVGTAMVTSMAPSAAARGQGPSNAGSPCPHPRQPSEWRRPPAPIIQITYGAPARPAVLARAVAASNTAPPAAPCPSVAAPAMKIVARGVTDAVKRAQHAAARLRRAWQDASKRELARRAERDGNAEGRRKRYSGDGSYCRS